MADNKNKSPKALKIDCFSGFYMYSKFTTSFMCIDFKVKITLFRDTLKIYGRL